MKYIVYLTTNLVNNKIYVGVHKTEDPEIFDGYYGGGINIKDLSKLKHPLTPFHYALKKYGFSNFKRSTIRVFDSYEEALKLESEIVNEEFILRKDTYNITLGGGMPPITCKEVHQFDLNGNYLNSYESIISAAKILNIDDSAISYAIRNKTTSGEYLWSYEKNIDFTKELQRKEVYIYTTDGEYLKSFKSITECARQLNVSYAPVLRAFWTGGKIKGYYIYYKKLEHFIPEKIKLTGDVHLYSLEGVYIKSFKSIKEVEKEFGCSMLGINLSIKMLKSYKDYLWWRGEKVEKLKPTTNKSKPRKVGQYDKEGNLILIFNTVRDARKLFSNVNKVLKGTAQYCKGYTFKYIS